MEAGENPNIEQVYTSNINTIKLLLLSIIALMVFMVFAVSYFAGEARARDEIRIRDIELIGKFLAAYKLNHGIYPSTAGSLPTEWQMYLDQFPTPPEPDGSCTTEQNRYDYKVLNGGTDYVLSFCLGSATKNFAAGVNNVKP